MRMSTEFAQEGHQMLSQAPVDTRAIAPNSVGRSTTKDLGRARERILQLSAMACCSTVQFIAAAALRNMTIQMGVDISVHADLVTKLRRSCPKGNDQKASRVG
jgi:hypothetical protein